MFYNLYCKIVSFAFLRIPLSEGGLESCGVCTHVKPTDQYRAPQACDPLIAPSGLVHTPPAVRMSPTAQ